MPYPNKAHPAPVGKSSYGLGRTEPLLLAVLIRPWRALSTARNLHTPRCPFGGTTPSEVPRVHFCTFRRERNPRSPRFGVGW
jgi:hypothetical protein